MSKVIFKIPGTNVPPPSGHINDIVFTDPNTGGVITDAIIPAGILNGTNFALMEAVGGTLPVTFTVSDAHFQVSGPHLQRRTVGGALTIAGSYNLTITASDVNGPFSKNFVVTIYDVPGQISLVGFPGASGQTGTIQNSAAAGAAVGNLTVVPANGGVLAQPITFALTADTKFDVVKVNSDYRLIRSGTGSLTIGVNEAPAARATDGNNVDSVDTTFTISVTGSAPPATAGRFVPHAPSAKKIYFVWNTTATGMNPTTTPTSTTPPNNGDLMTGTWAVEGLFANTWTVYSTDYPAIEGLTFRDRESARKYFLSQGITAYEIVYAPVGITGADPLRHTRYVGPWALQGPEIAQNDGQTVAEDISFMGTGFIDQGYGRTGVKLRDLAYCQHMHMVGPTGSLSAAFLDLSHAAVAESKYRIEGLRWGAFRELEAGSVVIPFNLQGMTDEASITFPAFRGRLGQTFVFADFFKQLSITKCEWLKQVASGIHGTGLVPDSIYKALLQVQDSVGRNNGDDNNDHNSYVGMMRNIVYTHSKFTCPTGHNTKFDNSQDVDITECVYSGYDAQYRKYARPGAKVFANEGVYYEAAKRQVPLVGPAEVVLYSWVSDTETASFTGSITGNQLTISSLSSGSINTGMTVSGAGIALGTIITTPNIQNQNAKTGVFTVNNSQTVASEAMTASITYVPYFDVDSDPLRTPITVLAAGSTPAAGQAARSITGTTGTTDKNNNSKVVFTFNNTERGKWVRVPAKGLFVSQNLIQNCMINFDNTNQASRIWNNIFYPFHPHATAHAVIDHQTRHITADATHVTRQPYYFAPPIIQFRMECVLGGVSPAGTLNVPKGWTGYITTPAPVSTKRYRLAFIDFPYPDICTPTNTPPPAFTIDPTIQYFGEFACDDGSTYQDTFTFGALISASQPTYDIDVTAGPPFGKTISGLSSRANLVVFKLATQSEWERPVINTQAQRAMFDCNASNYYWHQVTNPSDRSYVDLAKQEPTVWGGDWGFPVSYQFSNITIPQTLDTLTDSVTAYSAGNVTSTNTTYTTKLFSSTTSANNVIRLARAPLNANPRIGETKLWADDPRAGTFDFRLHNILTGAKGQKLLKDGTGGSGLGGSDVVRPNVIVQRDFYQLDYHMPITARYEASVKVDDASIVDGPLQAGDMIADMRIVPLADAVVSLDLNGCFRVTPAYKQIFAPALDRGKPFQVLTEIHVGDTDVDRCDIHCIVKNLTNPFTVKLNSNVVTVIDTVHNYIVGDRVTFLTVGATVGGLDMTGTWTVASVLTLNQYTFVHTFPANANIVSGSGGAVTQTCKPVVGYRIMLCADGQHGIGEAPHLATLTTVTPINATDFHVIFTPGLPKVGDADPVFGTITLGHEKALSSFANAVLHVNEYRGGQGCFGRPPVADPAWWIAPQNIPEAA